MMGSGQGKTEIPLDPVREVPRAERLGELEEHVWEIRGHVGEIRGR
jgi:hypothetical protein